MSNSMPAIFSRPLMGAAPQKETKTWRVAQGLGAVFAGMLAREMRKALSVDGKGPMGTSKGAGSEMYGAFFDQTMGKALAKSPAMAPLEAAIERSMTHQPHQEMRGAGGLGPAQGAGAADGLKISDSATSDRLGPVMLPPREPSMAPVLPPPPRLKG
jgi:Rod binding domain-containing protein